MSGHELKFQLETLLELLHEERKMAQTLDMEGLQLSLRKKKSCLQV